MPRSRPPHYTTGDLYEWLAAAFSAQGPFEGRLAVEGPGYQYMLGPFHLAGAAEIDRLGEVEAPAGDPEAKAAAGWQPEEGGRRVLSERHLDAGVEMEAEREGLAGGAGDQVLAPQVLAIGREIETPAMAGAQPVDIAVMTCLQPDLAVGLVALELDRRRRGAGLEPDRVGVVDGERGMGCGRALGVRPLPGRRPAPPRLTISRSRPTESSKDSGPAWRRSSVAGPCPQSMKMVVRPA